MNWARVGALDTWKGLALEAAWNIAPGQELMTPEPTWPLNPEELKDIRIFWPAQYQWLPASKWVDPLLHALTRYVRTERIQIPQTCKGIVVIQILLHGRMHDIAIDYLDLPAIDENCAERCSLYFKMQFSREGYRCQNVLPGGFITNSEDIYNYLPKLRALADRKRYRYDVYGRFGLDFAGEVRRKASSLLAIQPYFHWEGGLKTRRYSLALREIGVSKMCIDLPGNGPFCFRLIDYLAIGSCIIAPKHPTILHVPLVDRKHIVYAKEDLSDLIDLCRFYLREDNARETLCLNSRSFFDRYLHRDQLAAYYLHCCLSKLP